MMAYSAAVTFELPEEVERQFRERLNVKFLPSGLPLSPSDLDAAFAGYDAIVVTPPTQVDAEILSRLPASVKAIATYSVGLDHIDLEAAQKHGITVLNTPDVLTDAVAETAILLLLGAARRATESISLIRSRTWTGWKPKQLVGLGLSDKKLGILGMGRIGRGIAHRAKAFGMEIHYHNTRRLTPDQEEGAQYYADPNAMLSVIDALVLACPLTPSTRGFLDERRLSLMKRTALIVNIARGAIIEDEALINALKHGRIFAAGLDVFANEPHLDLGYYDLPNVFMLPHIGSSTVEARMMMGLALIDGLERLASGVNPPNRVT
jgi:lactate dehydrogenase-like 2-hydroxyacid dehydrogenase